MAILAINGGNKVRMEAFPSQNNIDGEEIGAVNRALHRGILSSYRGAWGDYFWGGKEIQALEGEFASYMGSKYAIACNSATSGLHIACGAVGVTTKDNVIVTPYSMCCSASAPLVYGANPVFADIEGDYFCIDPKEVEKTAAFSKAIIAVSLFGQSYDVPKINSLVNKCGGFVIEDAAQAIGSKYNGKYAGTSGDIGVFSFTQGKHLTAGEGGMLITDNEVLAMNCRLIMNHAEAVTNGMPKEMQEKYSHLYGYNMRMTEIQAAILRCQLKKLSGYVAMRQENVKRINELLSDIPAISTTPTRENCTHSYYVHAMKWDAGIGGMHRDLFVNAVAAELSGESGRADRPLLGNGYIKPLYRMPFFEKTHGVAKPVVEKLYERELFISMYHNLPLDETDLQDISNAFHKVWENKREIIKKIRREKKEKDNGN